MTRAVVIVAAAAAVGAAWWVMRQREQGGEAEAEAPADDDTSGGGWLANADDVLTGAREGAAEFIDNITGGFMKLSAMSGVNPNDLNHPNVRAMLAVIRRGEGTSGENGYRMLFGGGLFDGFADHPRVTVRKSGYTSTAAGAYQAIASSWDETRRLMGLKDFSPRSQDLFALGRLAARGALEDVKAGRFESAIRKIAREWASLPGSPYGQPTISMQTARDVYALAGGDDYMTA